MADSGAICRRHVSRKGARHPCCEYRSPWQWTPRCIRWGDQRPGVRGKAQCIDSESNPTSTGEGMPHRSRRGRASYLLFKKHGNWPRSFAFKTDLPPRSQPSGGGFPKKVLQGDAVTSYQKAACGSIGFVEGGHSRETVAAQSAFNFDRG